MARPWLFVRVHGCHDVATTVPPAVHDAARLVRAADPDACFFFDRTGDPAGHVVEVWLAASTEVRREVAARLRVPGEGWLATPGRDVARAVRHPHESGRDVTDELAAVSTAYALACVAEDAVEDPDVAFRLAVDHLRGLVELIDGDARALVFQCWLHWAAELSPRRRVDLSVEAATWARTPPAPSPELRTYLARTSEVVLGQRPSAGLPTNYLLFAQATATHTRLALSLEAGAAAAWTVRNELTGPVPALSGRFA